LLRTGCEQTSAAERILPGKIRLISPESSAEKRKNPSSATTPLTARQRALKTFPHAADTLITGKIRQRRALMALLNWGQNYSVGVQAIDGQHKVLFDIVNELHGAMLKGQAQTLTGPLLRKLAKYTQEHFTAEEAAMASAMYPGLADHKIKHRDLIKQVDDYIARFDKGEVTLNLHLLNFLRDWLATHIQKTDKEYGPWLNERGIR
jgi:hemerythrin-like metal-binding protein